MNKIIVFGLLDFAELAHFYIENDTEDEVVAFTVHSDYMPENTAFKGLPVVPFEELSSLYDPSEYLFFAPMSGSNINQDRAKVYQDAKTMGFTCYSYISSRATCLTTDIGDNCFILEDNTIQPFVKVGNNVVMWSGNHIGHHSIIEDNVLFTSQVVLSGHCHVKRNAWFGVNATIRDNCTIGEGALIAMSASVTKDVSPWAIVKGIPGKEGGDSRRIKM